MHKISDDQVKEIVKTKVSTGALRELLFCDGECVRVSYAIKSYEAKEYIDIINQRFPDYSKYISSSSRNLIGMSVAYREPYVGDSISCYIFTSIPDDICDKFGININEKNYKNFFGLKFDLQTNKVMCKVQYNGNLNFPNSSFLGEFHNEEKQVHENIDVYISPESAENFLRERKMLRNAFYDLCSIVINSKTKEIKNVKGYKVFNKSLGE